MLSAEELQLRYELHDRIVQQTGNFRWLQFGHFDPTSQSITAAHPLNRPESRVVQISDDGTVNISISEYKRVMLNDFTLYFGSYKSWIIPIASFPIFNPTKCYRFVSFMKFYNLLLFFFHSNFNLKFLSSLLCTWKPCLKCTLCQ